MISHHDLFKRSSSVTMPMTAAEFIDHTAICRLSVETFHEVIRSFSGRNKQRRIGDFFQLGIGLPLGNSVKALDL